MAEARNRAAVGALPIPVTMCHMLHASKRIIGVVTVAVAVATAGAVTALAATTNSTVAKDVRYYLALGDSLAYGYQPVTPLDRAQGYVPRIQKMLTPGVTILNNLGCNGETTTSMIEGGTCDFGAAKSQLDAAETYLAAHKSATILVTIDIGANDMNACTKTVPIDMTCVARVKSTIEVNLSKILIRLRLVAPHVNMIGMTYYNPQLARWLTGVEGQEQARQSVALLETINNSMKAQYASKNASVADVSEAFSSNDLTTMVPLSGTVTVPLAVARICQWTWMCAPAPYGPDIHANAAGYEVIANTFKPLLPPLVTPDYHIPTLPAD